MQLTQEQQKKIKRVAKLVDFENQGAVVLLEDIFALEDKIPELKELIEELRKKSPDRDEVNKLISDIKIPKAINGDKGDKGDDYILTKEDKREIASMIDVPVVDRIVETIREKTEVIREQPIEIIKEVAIIDKTDLTKEGEAIRDGLELLQDEERLDKKAIKGLDDYEEISFLARQPKNAGGKQLFSQMNDVNMQGVTNGQVPVYNSATGLYEAGTASTDLTPYWKTDGSSGSASGNWDLGGVYITDALNNFAIDVGARQLDDVGLSVSLDWSTRHTFSGGVISIDWGDRYLKNDSGDTTIDWRLKQLISSGITTVDWGGGQLTDTSGVNAFNWNTRTINNSLNRAVYDGELNYMYAFSGVNHVVIDISTQRLLDISGQASIHWTNRELYANDGGTVLANYADVTGMRFKPKIFVGSNLTTAPVSAIHVDSGTAVASELRFTAGTTTGQTTTDGFQIGVTNTGIAEIRQRENLGIDVYTNNALAMAISSTGNVGIGTSPASARLHAVSITEQFRLGYSVSNYMNVIINSTGSPTFALIGTTPEFYFSNPVNVPYEIYGAGWNGNLEVPTKDAVYDKIESLNPIFGTYTPTLTNTTNVSASTARLCTYMRVGNTVTVAGQFDIDCIAPATATVLRITLPVASNFSTAYQLGGTAFANAVAGMGAGIEADIVNDTALVKFNSSDINNQTMSFTFSYQVI